MAEEDKSKKRKNTTNIIKKNCNMKDKKFQNKDKTDEIVCYEPKPRPIKQNKKLLKCQTQMEIRKLQP